MKNIAINGLDIIRKSQSGNKIGLVYIKGIYKVPRHASNKADG